MHRPFRRGAALAVVAGAAAVLAVTGMAAVGSGSSPAAALQYEKKVTICHRTGSKKHPFVTIRVSRRAVPAHLRHGDTLGPCARGHFVVCHKGKHGRGHTMRVKGDRKLERHLKHGDRLGKCKRKGHEKGHEKHKGKDKEKHKGGGKKKG
jgi:hypothetical protein